MEKIYKITTFEGGNYSTLLHKSYSDWVFVMSEINNICNAYNIMKIEIVPNEEL